MESGHEARKARNEALFREVNENIVGLARDLGGTAVYDFICECANSDCYERVPLTLAEYDGIRGDGTHFLLAPGHEDPAIERVVADRGAHVVVEKQGVAAVVAATADPRS